MILQLDELLDRTRWLILPGQDADVLGSHAVLVELHEVLGGERWHPSPTHRLNVIRGEPVIVH